jgi:hypothetical protein
MSDKQKQQYCKKYKSVLGLTQEQCEWHFELVTKQTTRLWPQELYAYCQDLCEKESIREDITINLETLFQTELIDDSTEPGSIDIWVADWLKEGNRYDDPFDKETPEEAERGRLDALKFLQET